MNYILQAEKNTKKHSRMWNNNNSKKITIERVRHDFSVWLKIMNEKNELWSKNKDLTFFSHHLNEKSEFAIFLFTFPSSASVCGYK